MMHRKREYILAALVWLAVSFFMVLNAQPVGKTKEQKKFDSGYELKTLSPDTFPNLLPYNRWIDPAGSQVYFGNPELENHALDVALSPDGKWVAVEGRYEVVILSVETGKLAAQLPMKEFTKDPGAMNTFSGIAWLQENGAATSLFWGAVGSRQSSYVMEAAWDGKVLTFRDSCSFEAVAPSKSALPNEVLVRREEGKRILYVALNGNNTVLKMELDEKRVLWSTRVGVAPFGLAMANGKIYVTNWAGSVPDQGDADVAGVPWGSAKVDAKTGAVREGTVSVLDPKSGLLRKELPVGLHPNDIISSADGKFVFVANANSDTVCSLSTETDDVAETISVRLLAGKNRFWGDSPNGLGLSRDGRRLFVANGMDNALAVVVLGRKSGGRSPESSRLTGFIPTGAYPGAVIDDGRNRLFVANIEAEGANLPSLSKETNRKSYNSHKQKASVSIIPIPDDKKLRSFTKKVEESNQLFRLALLKKLPRKNARPVCVPERTGEPSVFKHVLYIIKENRTYDQILGDMKKGDGDPSLALFGQQVTPNTHRLCEEFLLLDNFYVSGKCSAEGHQWTDASIVTDYIEKDVRAWIRSYPHVQEDALVYAPSGFLWDNALRHGKKVRIFGEASVPEYDPKHTWTSIYRTFLNKEKFEFRNKTTIKPVEAILSPTFPSYDDHRIPDALRAEAFIRELKEFEQKEGDTLPELMIMALPNDHTGGTRPGLPTPRAMVADNDLALGRIIEAVTRSRFWENTVVFVTEDDSQNGWDHVSAYRTVGMVISPYTRTGRVVHINYNQPSMVRTIEQILGIPPMNIMDATARPMFECFSDKADLTPYQALNNLIPLDEMNPALTSLKGDALYYAEKSMSAQFDRIDSGDDDLFNRILWFSMKGKAKYPEKYAGKDSDDDR